MPRIILLCALCVLASTMVLAQQPVGNSRPPPATGAPGTATPQPYAPVAPQHLPSAPAYSAPLLKQAPLPERLQPRTDQDVPLLREQHKRNAQPPKKLSE